MLVAELIKQKVADASEIEASVNELSRRTIEYRQFKTLRALKNLQRAQAKLIGKVQNTA